MYGVLFDPMGLLLLSSLRQLAGYVSGPLKRLSLSQFSHVFDDRSLPLIGPLFHLVMWLWCCRMLSRGALSPLRPDVGSGSRPRGEAYHAAL